MAAVDIEGEYDDLANLVASFEPEDWDVESLCSGWSVRDVVEHLVVWDDVLVLRSRWAWAPQLIAYGLFVRGAFSVDRVNDQLRQREQPTEEELLTRLREASRSKRRLFDRLAPGAQLAELMIHHQDVRRALHRERPIPPERLADALEGARHLPGAGVKRRTDGLALHAYDIGWASGTGALSKDPARPS